MGWKGEVNMALSDYQRERVNDVRQWYENTYRPLEGYPAQSIRYMALWAVFNALYNIADHPKVKLRNVKEESGVIKPYIRGRGEDDKIGFISKQLGQDEKFVAAIIGNHFEFITHLAHRTPEVQQPPNTKSIQFAHDGQSYTLDLSKLHGIASLDNRVFLDDRKALFQYHHLELDLNNGNLPKDKEKFCQQLIYMLYQLRNNIVHGGSAAFFMQKTELTIGAMSLLDDIVQYLFANPQLLLQDP